MLLSCEFQKTLSAPVPPFLKHGRPGGIITNPPASDTPDHEVANSWSTSP